MMWFWDDAENHFDEKNGFLQVDQPLHKTYAYADVYSVTPSGSYTQEMNRWVYGEGDGPARLWLQNNVIEALDGWGGSGSKVQMMFEALDPHYDKGGSSGGTSGGGAPPPAPTAPVDEGCGAAILGTGAVLYPGESVGSCNGRVVLFHQTDGNVVLLHDGTPRWHTGTHGWQSESLVMQGDGNLVLYAPGGTPLWASGTHGHGGGFAAVQEDCNFVVYSAESAPLWASASSCY